VPLEELFKAGKNGRRDVGVGRIDTGCEENIRAE
jgi:hypothetical protein